jgi:hypothetical protein
VTGLGHGLSGLAHRFDVHRARFADQTFYLRACLADRDATRQIGGARTPPAIICSLIDDQVLAHLSSLIAEFRRMLASCPTGIVLLRLPATVMTDE